MQKKLPFLCDRDYVVDGSYVFKRIAGQGDEVRVLSSFQRAYLARQSQDLCAVARCSDDRLLRLNTVLYQPLQLVAEQAVHRIRTEGEA